MEPQDLLQAAVSEAATFLLQWLEGGWIHAPHPWRLEEARVEVHRDWYSPCWIVTFTILTPPWFGDSIKVEVETEQDGSFWVPPSGPEFARENILCIHRDGILPAGHWSWGRGARDHDEGSGEACASTWDKVVR
jgi:hypothetical protein